MVTPEDSHHDVRTAKALQAAWRKDQTLQEIDLETLGELFVSLIAALSLRLEIIPSSLLSVIEDDGWPLKATTRDEEFI